MNSASFPRFLRHHFPLGLVILLGTVLSMLVFQIKREAVTGRQQAAFAEIAHEYYQVFRREIEVHVEVIHALGDFLLASPDADADAFRSFARGSLDRRPAVKALQWIPRVAGQERAQLEARARDEGMEDFTLQDLADSGDLVPAAEKEVHYPVYYVEPLEENRAALGLDYASDERRLAAVRRAMANRSLVVSDQLRLAQDPDGQPVTLFLLPIFASGQSEPVGVVGAAIDLTAIARSVESHRQHLKIALLDMSGQRPRWLLSLNADPGEGRRRADYETEFKLPLGGREWLLLLQAREEDLAAQGRAESWAFLLGGLLFTGLVATWVRQRQTYTSLVEQQVADRTAALSRINESLQEQVRQRHQAETKLQRSEVRFREAFHHAPVGIGLLSPGGKWIQVNAALAEMTGYPEEALTSKSIGDLLHPDDADHEIARWAQILAGGMGTFSLEQRLRHANGNSVWVLTSVSQVRDGDGSLLYFICQILDITDQKEALEETRQAKEFSENIIRSSSDGILAFDRNGSFTVWNGGMEKMTGIPAAEALGRPAASVLPFLGDSNDGRAFNRVLAGATVKATDRPFSISSTGKTGYYEASYSPLHDGAGGIIGGVGLVRDVTEQKRARERLQNFTALLRQRNRELQDFAYVASHDLQEPLRKIRAFGDRLQTRSEAVLDEQAKDYLRRMQDASRRMQILISDLLSFSRVSTDAHPFSLVKLSDIAREVLSDLEERINKAGATVEIGELPEIEADPTQMRQLLQNLISNGLKYQKSGNTPRVEISAAEYMRETDLPPLDGHGCLIRVRDNGIGFDEKYLDRIFTVFQRLHGRHDYEGTGIGLAICRKIVERHHGWITARSTPDQGATFIVALPYKQNRIN